MFRRFFLMVALGCLLLCLAGLGTALGASSVAHSAAGSGAGSNSSRSVVIPPEATRSQLNEIMASLSDGQVRSLLMSELEKKASPPTPPSETGLAAFIKEMKQKAAFVRKRFAYLFSGASTAPQELPKVLSAILSGSDKLPPGKLLLAIVVLSVLWKSVVYLFKRKTKQVRKSIAAASEGAAWYTRMGRLFLRALLDLFGVLIFTVVVFLCYLTLFSEGSASKPVIIAWLVAMIFLELVKVASRFLLAPHAPTLRYLPLSDSVAQYLFRWTVNVARVIAAGLLVTTLLRLEGGSEALLLLVSIGFSFLVAFMLVLLALWNKRPVAESLRQKSAPGSLLHQLAGSWHVGAITYVLFFWVFWVVALMLFGGKAMLPGVVTLLVVPAYFLLDWATQRLVCFAVDMADVDASGVKDENHTTGTLNITKFQRFLSMGFRVLVFASSVFFLLRVWGIDLTLGRDVVRAGIHILIALILAYILWVSVSGFIERKLKGKNGGPNGDAGGGDGGGPGGDRFGTLLQLLKKFIFASIAVVTVLIVLSSMGVDIGPLIAGASVFGIAIGFGAQTLVKDIISGIFFLTDDAFRVGDYIETAGAMGTVEGISVRSLKLRHHLGFLYTIPFGSMHMVKNNTRDWAIMKLKYMVPFDTDIQQVKKIINKINDEIRAIPELNQFMLSDIKSQGVKAMAEYGMLMRVKFMTKPGGQFTLRSLVLAKLRKYFAEAGIEFAKPRVTVHIPERERLTTEDEAIAAAAASQVVNTKASEKKKK